MINCTIKYILLGVLLLSILVSCNAEKRKNSVEDEKKMGIYRVVIELILDDENQKDLLLNELGKVTLDSYQWKNHIVLYGAAEDTVGLNSRIRQTGIRLKTKYYNTPMYVFDRSVRCPDSVVEDAWNDYLLTANLVADSVLQQEYLDFHAKQFDEWPEVAEGFCKAGFQQLLVFKNGRQLMLVISVPADKTLDELNPKTIENNPRMIEWNQIMGKYQKGIEGTSPEEIWVFLSKIK
ncbi:L-rhamnose mutarotase [Prolixibacteraceae bacterium Z1-6]|uniref:L-rhamnose mutarotase n=1 Tax=Draconibacterium aestuarii TaxID=2998507 RepID=A0A9X3J7Z9_9BACT|nr:L-rhamnose mutarotase [Prolixibacteraceae bacterium Z1-6]